MKNNHQKARSILEQAMIAISEGSEKHGDTAKSFEMIAQMWTTYIAHSMALRKQVALTSFDVANMMMMVKQARSIYGHSPDNQVDAAGYAAIAAMLDPVGNLDKELTDALDDKNGKPKANSNLQIDRGARPS